MSVALAAAATVMFATCIGIPISTAHALTGALLLYFFLCTVSHGVLDAMTDGGLGVAFFAPWNNERYFLPWRPLKVPPIGIPAFFSRRGLAVIGSELFWVGVPLVLITVVGVALRRKRNSGRG